MTTHAQQSKTVSIAAQVAQLPHLPMQNIWAMWDAHFDERPQHHRLLPGTMLSRFFDDQEHKVVVRGVRDFEYRGQRFKSLSAIARLIAGCPWSGPAFFGLKSTKKEAA